MRKILALACITVTALLTACGGGGGGGSKTTETFTPQAMTVALADTSYANAKMRNIAPVTLPTEVKGQDVFAVAEFKAGSNEAVLFTAKLNGASAQGKDAYSGSMYFKEEPATYQFWSQGPSGWQASGAQVVGTPCLHPRKAMVIEVNGDTVPDVVLACHGYDNYAQLGVTQGERMQVLLSQPNGSYSVVSFGSTGYWHGAAAYKDINGKTYVVGADTKSQTLVKFDLASNGNSSETVITGVNTSQKYTVEVVKNGTDFDAYVAGNGAVLKGQMSDAASFGVVSSSTTTGYGTVVDLAVNTNNEVFLAYACYDAVNCTDTNSTDNTSTITKLANGTETGKLRSTTAPTSGKGWISQLTVYNGNLMSADSNRGALAPSLAF